MTLSGSAAVGRLEEGRRFEHVDGERDRGLDELFPVGDTLGRPQGVTLFDPGKLLGDQILGLSDQLVCLLWR